MYFFYMDEAGSRDPSIGTSDKPKDHIYVLLAVGLFEKAWHSFDRDIAHLKLELIDYLRKQKNLSFNLADCEIKSNWLRQIKTREDKSPFLHALDEPDRNRLVGAFLDQLEKRKMIIMAAVIDKRYLQGHMTHETMHKKAYEFLLERIEGYMVENHPKHNALIVMDDTSKELNQAVALKHALFQRAGNQNMTFRHIVEYPFFTRSELSNGVQLADLLAYNVYHAFRYEKENYDYFLEIAPYLFQAKTRNARHGLKVWPEQSPLTEYTKPLFQTVKKSYEEGG